MLKNVSSRNNLLEKFKNNELFLLISHVGNKYLFPSCPFRLPPLDIFEMVVGWLDKISREPDDEEVEIKLEMAWLEIRGQYQTMAEEKAASDDALLDEMTCTTLCLLMRCLDMLSESHVPSNHAYWCFSQKIGAFLDSSYLNWEDLYYAIITDSYHKRHQANLQKWVEEYMMDRKALYTDENGKLKSNVTIHGKAKGNSKTALFAMQGGSKNDKDEKLTSYWKDCFLAILSERSLSGKEINASKKNPIFKYLDAFRKYLETALGYKMPSSPAPYLRFLMDDCGIPCEKSETPVLKVLGDLLNQNVETENVSIESNVYSFIRNYMKENPLPHKF